MDNEKRKQSKAEWDKNNTTQIKLKLNNNTDADILERLESVESKQTYFKGLIRADIKLEDEIVRSNEYDDVLEYLKDISNKTEEEADAHASNYVDDTYPDMDDIRKKKIIKIAVEQFLRW